MMSDLAEIAAAAGIDIIDGDYAVEKGSEEAENACAAKEAVTDEWAGAEQIHNWEVAFSDRYTVSDPDYANTVDVSRQQPCVIGFSCFRQRDDRRNWDRDRRGGYRGRGNQHGGWNRNRGDSGDSSGWNRGERSHYQPQNFGDHHHRGYGNQHNRSEGNSNSQSREYGHHQNRGGHDSYQNRGNANNRDRREPQSQHSRSDGGDRRNRNETQGNRDTAKGGFRDRSPQR